jgi:tetratricopeptide (TPR) repeat protein
MKIAKKLLPSIAPSLAIALALVAPQAASALSCDEIMNMVDVNVPENIVVMTMKDSGDQFSSDEVSCLEDRGAPAAVLTQAKSMQAAEAPPEPATRETRATEAPPPEKGPSALDDDEDELGARAKRGSDADELPENGSRGGDAGKVSEAIKLYKAKKPLTASLMFYDLLQEGSFPEQETKIHYYLGRSLQDLEMLHTAQYHFLLVVKKGPSNPYFNYALPQLVKIARYTGDDTELQRIVSKIPPDAYPRGAKSDLYYLMGVRYYSGDKLSEARKAFGQVSTKSPHYLKSEYFRGVIFNQQGKLKSAVRSFREVYRQEVEYLNDPRYLLEIEDIKGLALLNIARIYYGIERYDDAAKWYELVDHNSKYWPEALFEHAWANFMMTRLNDTLGMLLTIRSGFFKNDQFVPEATVLRALTYFNLCEYETVEKILLDFEDTHRPMNTEMTEFVGQYASKEGKKLADQAWDTYFGPDAKTDTVLPKSFFNKVLRNRDLAGIVRHLELMEHEEELISKQKDRWQDAMSPYLRKVIESDRQRYKRRAGLLLLKEMARQSNKIADLLTQSEIVRFEVVDAQRVDYAYKASNVDVTSAAEQSIDFATAVDFIYWPFNGEFWEDELGYYSYTEEGACN